MTKAKYAVSALLFLTGVVALALQHQSLTSLSNDNQSLRHENAILKSVNTRFSNAVVRASQSLPEDQAKELLRLRGEVAMLRKRSSGTSDLRQQNQKLQAELVRAQASKEQNDKVADERRAAAIVALKQVGDAVALFASNREVRYATNVEQFYNELGRTNSLVGVSMNGIEFVNLEQLDSTLTNQYVFREREPRMLPDGRWEWLYGTPDGQIEAMISDTGNFDDFENEDQTSGDDEDTDAD
jgi:hypothetical protein